MLKIYTLNSHKFLQTFRVSLICKLYLVSVPNEEFEV